MVLHNYEGLCSSPHHQLCAEGSPEVVSPGVLLIMQPVPPFCPLTTSPWTFCVICWDLNLLLLFNKSTAIKIGLQLCFCLPNVIIAKDFTLCFFSSCLLFFYCFFLLPRLIFFFILLTGQTRMNLIVHSTPPTPPTKKKTSSLEQDSPSVGLGCMRITFYKIRSHPTPELLPFTGESHHRSTNICPKCPKMADWIKTQLNCKAMYSSPSATSSRFRWKVDVSGCFRFSFKTLTFARFCYRFWGLA